MVFRIVRTLNGRFYNAVINEGAVDCDVDSVFDHVQDLFCDDVVQISVLYFSPENCLSVPACFIFANFDPCIIYHLRP